MIPPGFVGCADCPADDVCQFCRPRLDGYLTLLDERYGHIGDERINTPPRPQTPTEARAVLDGLAIRPRLR